MNGKVIKMVSVLAVYLVLALTSCTKETTELVELKSVSYKEFFEFTSEFTGMNHVIELDFENRDVMLYTRVGECIRPVREGDGIFTPVGVMEIKGNSMLVELSNGALIELTKSDDGNVLGISGLPGVATKVFPWLIYKCND